MSISIVTENTSILGFLVPTVVAVIAYLANMICKWLKADVKIAGSINKKNFRLEWDDPTK